MRGSLPIALAAGTGAAASFGLASAVQHLEAARALRRGPLDPRLLGQLIRRPLWQLSFVAETAAIGLQTLALRYGPVALVQAFLVTGLPVAVLLSALFDGRRLGMRELVGLALCAIGVGVLACVLPTSEVAANTPATAPALSALVVVMLVIVVLLRAGRAARWSGVTAGAAAGVAIGTASVLLAVSAAGVDRPNRLLASWPPYALVAVGLAGLALAQSAFQTGALGPPLASLTLVEPVAAVVLAAALLHQGLPTRVFDVVGAVLGAALGAGGVLLLAGPPVPALPRPLPSSG